MKVIYLYNIVSFILLPVYFLALIVRWIKGKANVTSVIQQLSLCMPPRPEGKLIWLHAASVGESMLALTLVRGLNKLRPELNFLITTGTLSSAALLARLLPENGRHQFVPLDNIITVRRFINHWRPTLGIFIESELWYCLINESAKKFDLALLNARLSDRSYARWKKMPQLFCAMVNNFKCVITQSPTDLNKYHQLGCTKAINLGNLKFANQKLAVDEKNLVELKKLFSGKKIFVAGSTHHEDEEVVLQVIKDLKKEHIDYYPIIVLRHPERRDEVAKQCKKLGLSFTIRSDSKLPSLKDDLYIVDTLGELGLFYSLAFISFIGGSFTFKLGGHNLMEPAYFNNVIILGPDMSNFRNITEDMINMQAAIQIKDAKGLADKMKFFFDEKNSKIAALYSKNALHFVKDKEEILNHYLNEVRKLLA